jgi:hypothetical protein
MPDASPSLPPISDAERAQIYSGEADGQWELVVGRYPDATRPDVTEVRSVDPSEWGKVMTACLRGEGYDASAAVGGGIASGDIPVSQGEAYAIALYKCTVQFPFDPHYYIPLVESQVEFLYRYYVDELVPCLAKSGYEVQDPPSWTSFRDQFGAEHAWAPYVSLHLSPTQSAAAESKCPQTPSGLFGTH